MRVLRVCRENGESDSFQLINCNTGIEEEMAEKKESLPRTLFLSDARASSCEELHVSAFEDRIKRNMIILPVCLFASVWLPTLKGSSSYNCYSIPMAVQNNRIGCEWIFKCFQKEKSSFHRSDCEFEQFKSWRFIVITIFNVPKKENGKPQREEEEEHNCLPFQKFLQRQFPFCLVSSPPFVLAVASSWSWITGLNDYTGWLL